MNNGEIVKHVRITSICIPILLENFDKILATSVFFNYSFKESPTHTHTFYIYPFNLPSRWLFEMRKGPCAVVPDLPAADQSKTATKSD